MMYSPVAKTLMTQQAKSIPTQFDMPLTTMHYATTSRYTPIDINSIRKKLSPRAITGRAFGKKFEFPLTERQPVSTINAQDYGEEMQLMEDLFMDVDDDEDDAVEGYKEEVDSRKLNNNLQSRILREYKDSFFNSKMIKFNSRKNSPGLDTGAATKRSLEFKEQHALTSREEYGNKASSSTIETDRVFCPLRTGLKTETILFAPPKTQLISCNQTAFEEKLNNYRIGLTSRQTSQRPSEKGDGDISDDSVISEKTCKQCLSFLVNWQ